MTPAVEACWQTYWRSADAFRRVYEINKESPTQLYVNTMFEFLSIASNMAVLTADIFFEDWLSLAFYMGDTLYRLLVV